MLLVKSSTIRSYTYSTMGGVGRGDGRDCPPKGPLKDPIIRYSGLGQ